MHKHGIFVSALLTIAIHATAQTKSPAKSMTDPQAVHQSAIVIDTHADTPQRFVDEHWDFTDPLNGGMLNYYKRQTRKPQRTILLHLGRPRPIPRQRQRPPHPLAHRRHPRASPQTPRQTSPLRLRRRHHRHPRTRKIRRPHGHRRRPLYRERPRPTPRLLPSRRPLHDSHLVQHQQLGRLLRRHRRRQQSTTTTASHPSANRSSPK